MMNLLSLSLLISSLAAAGFLSPHPDPSPPIREGHRIFVVEYEREVSPPSSSTPPSPPVSGDLSGEFKDAGSDFSNSLEEKVTSLITKTKHKAAQLEESSADAVKDISEKAKNTSEELAANISATTRKSAHQAETTAAKLEENLTDIMRRARVLGRGAILWCMWLRELGERRVHRPRVAPVVVCNCVRNLRLGDVLVETRVGLSVAAAAVWDRPE